MIGVDNDREGGRDREREGEIDEREKMEIYRKGEAKKISITYGMRAGYAKILTIG